ncbi:metal transporter [Desulfococcaceae bacterium HSG8]|nr:metal transporter [Desulfococcaceae bacterium HSG8]
MIDFGMEEYSPEALLKKNLSLIKAANAAQNYWVSFTKYANDFMIPYMSAVNYFTSVEILKLFKASPLDSFRSYMDLLEFNADLSNKGLTGSMRAINNYNQRELDYALSAMFNTFFNRSGEENIDTFISRQAKMMDMVAYGYSQAIDDIEPEYGFHFERDDNSVKIAETDRFILYQVLPIDKKVEVNKSGKPVIIMPPYVLGSNILGFLPHENRSYTHCFANQGIPVYMRVMKDISTTPAVQILTGEDDALDTKFFCEKVMGIHGKPVTLNGYCQGGFVALCNILSGELDGLVDAFISCVSPMDGTRSKGFEKFFGELPERFNHLDYGTKTLGNGNKVADGDLMGWVYKLKSIENEFPIVAFYRDMTMLTPRGDNGDEIKISKTAAAINYWLKYERNDLPLSITKMSFDSYNTAITDDGTLPIKLFDRKLNLKRIKEKGITWLICYGEKDDLVEKETALAPLDYIDAEVSPFPKGHVAIATSWSNPKSACALHTCFGDKKYRGPVRFQLDIDKELSEREV